MSKLMDEYLKIVKPLIDTGLFTEEELTEGVEERLRNEAN